MAVGAGSIKRASKLNAETKKTVVANADEQVAEVVEKALKQQTAAEKKPVRKTTARKSTKPATEKKEAEVIVTSPEVPEAVTKRATPKNDKNKACHLTEDMPIHLL